ALQMLGHAEHAAELADVLAHEEHPRVLLHRAPQAGVHGPRERHRLERHAAPPSNDVSYSASQAACRSMSAGGSEYTCANMLSGSGGGSETTRWRASAASASPSASTSAKKAASAPREARNARMRAIGSRRDRKSTRLNSSHV